MTKLTVRDVPDEVVEKLDAIVQADGYSSRNDLVKNILATYVLSKENMLLNALPPIVRALCSNELKILTEQAELTMEALLEIVKRLEDVTLKQEIVYNEVYFTSKENS